MAQRETKKSKKSDSSSWLQPRVTRSRGKKDQERVLNAVSLKNDKKRSLNSTRGRDRDQNPAPRPDPPANPNLMVPAIPRNPTPKPPVVAAANQKAEKRTITEILNELYTNPDFPTA